MWLVKVTILIFCGLLGLFLLHIANSQIAYGIKRLELWPDVFRFNNGETALYFKQIGKGDVHAFYNGTAFDRVCDKVRYIYGKERSIDGFWMKCTIPGHHGHFMVRTAYPGRVRYKNYDQVEF